MREAVPKAILMSLTVGSRFLDKSTSRRNTGFGRSQVLCSLRHCASKAKTVLTPLSGHAEASVWKLCEISESPALGGFPTVRSFANATVVDFVAVNFHRIPPESTDFNRAAASH
jgi:hypothetical protein